MIRKKHQKIQLEEIHTQEIQHNQISRKETHKIIMHQMSELYLYLLHIPQSQQVGLGPTILQTKQHLVLVNLQQVKRIMVHLVEVNL